MQFPQFLRQHKRIAAAGGVATVALVAYLAFGFFGIHTAFIDDEVNEAGPVFASGATLDVGSAATTTPAPLDVTADEPDSTDGQTSASSPPSSEPDDPDTTQPQIRTVATGSFVDSRIHSGTGDATVLTDGVQRFLRFEENFETDNGPDLNVYLRADDGSFVDLGDLKGNIGSQNYEIPAEVDLARFHTVDVWCVRFGVSFTTAALT